MGQAGGGVTISGLAQDTPQGRARGFLWFRYFYLRGRNGEISHPLVHYTNAYNSQDWSGRHQELSEDLLCGQQGPKDSDQHLPGWTAAGSWNPGGLESRLEPQEIPYGREGILTPKPPLHFCPSSAQVQACLLQTHPLEETRHLRGVPGFRTLFHCRAGANPTRPSGSSQNFYTKPSRGPAPAPPLPPKVLGENSILA